MSIIVMPRRFTAQPQQVPPIDWGNPITNKLVFAGFPSGGSMVNAVSGQRGTLSGAGAPTLANTPAGNRSVLHNGGVATNSYVDFGTADANLADIALAPCTFFFWARPTGITAQGGLAERNDNNTVSAGWLVGTTTTNKLKFLAENSTLNTVVSTIAPVTLNVYSSFAVSWARDVAFSDLVNDSRLYYAGVPSPHVLDQAGSGSPGSDSANSLFLGRNQFVSAGTGSTGSFDGNIELALMWKRKLSSAEIWSLHTNRYQVFKAPARKLHVIPISSTRRPQLFVAT